MIYKVITGSRAMNINLPKSDYDLLVVTEKELDKTSFKKMGYDLLSLKPKDFINPNYPKGGFAHYLDLFPSVYCLDNDLTDWLKENREDIVLASLPKVLEVFNNSAQHFYRRATNAEEQKMFKHFARVLHTYNILHNYAEGKTFADSVRATGEERDLILSIRKGEVPQEEVIELLQKTKARAISVENFYKEPRADMRVLDEFKHMVYREVELLNKEEGGN